MNQDVMISFRYSFFFLIKNGQRDSLETYSVFSAGDFNPEKKDRVLKMDWHKSCDWNVNA